MNALRKYGGFASCFLMSLLSAAALEAGSVVRLGETVPRAILFGLGLFALWLAIWLLGMRVVVAASARQAITDPFHQFRAEFGDVIRIWALGSCAIILFILFPGVQGFAMPPCSVLAVKLFCLLARVAQFGKIRGNFRGETGCESAVALSSGVVRISNPVVVRT